MGMPVPLEGNSAMFSDRARGGFFFHTFISNQLSVIN